MPMLQLLIKNQVIRELPILFKGETFEDRQQEVAAATDYLKSLYRTSIIIYPEKWEIRIEGVESKMNPKRILRFSDYQL